jgi:hypothetical protein
MLVSCGNGGDRYDGVMGWCVLHSQKRTLRFIIPTNCPIRWLLGNCFLLVLLFVLSLMLT